VNLIDHGPQAVVVNVSNVMRVDAAQLVTHDQAASVLIACPVAGGAVRCPQLAEPGLIEIDLWDI